MIAEPFLWAGFRAGFFPGTIFQSSLELYKVGTMTVPIPQMETLRLREVRNSTRLTQPVSNTERHTPVHIGASAPTYVGGPCKSKPCPASKDTLLV